MASSPISYRFIPTLVGNTLKSISLTLFPPVHPHARGEHGTATACLLSCSGSSPRSWGTRISQHIRHGWRRFIPTLVGNTPFQGKTCQSVPVHPHARGEHEICSRNIYGNLGSSPRSWGTLPPHLCHLTRRRFIPTLVGNTLRHFIGRRKTAVHPHARGEHC